MSTIDEFLVSDVQSLAARGTYLGYAKNVQSGHHAELELTGNAFNVQFLPSGIRIENLWNEEAEPIYIGSEDFIRIVFKWLPKR